MNKNNKYFRQLIFLILGISFQLSIHAQSLTTGTWRGVFTLTEGTKEVEIPFNFEAKTDSLGNAYIELINGEERIRIDEIFSKGDSILINFPVYEKMMKARLTGDELRGFWINPKVAGYSIPFVAHYGDSFRFAKDNAGKPLYFGGKWKTIFRPGEKNAFDALGEFVQRGNKITGTFQTEYGDFRYLQGNIVKGELRLSNFDGGHIYLFTASRVAEDSLVGKFYSGKRPPSKWIATRDEKFKLRNPDELTKIKEGYATVNFEIPDESGTIISPQGDAFKNKVRIIQVSGTWCPNCMDETKFLVELNKEKNNPDLKIIGLSFERYKDKTKAYQVINKFKKRYGVNYDFIYAGITKDIGKVLPMLDNFMSFPTMIVLDKSGKVVKVHTGFYGPATGKYKSFKAEFNEFIDKLLAE